ncbi:MAG TPA: hypothetical protein VI895_10505 [Bdellovibrionota bacterium]|nr:hypothetical protein [Bdellovibrionota bacterium]
MTNEFFEKLVAHSEAHARFVNSLSFVEYIGARKILKSQHADNFSFELLSHVAEEIRHAQVLKRLALRMSDGLVTSYRPEHLLAGQEAEAYIQAIDHAVEQEIGGEQHWKNYLLTTLVVEERAKSFYSEYETVLARCGYGGILAAIVREEEGHLKKMYSWLSADQLGYEYLLGKLRKREQSAFEIFLRSAANEIH